MPVMMFNTETVLICTYNKKHTLTAGQMSIPTAQNSANAWKGL